MLIRCFQPAAHIPRLPDDEVRQRFFIYPPVMLLGVTALDFNSKKAAGTAAGFIGLFGYLGRTVQGKALGVLAERYGWNAGFYAILGSTFLGIVLLSMTWRLKPGVAVGLAKRAGPTPPEEVGVTKEVR